MRVGGKACKANEVKSNLFDFISLQYTILHFLQITNSGKPVGNSDRFKTRVSTRSLMLVVLKYEQPVSLRKISLYPLPILIDLGTLMPDVFFRLMEKCVFFYSGFSEYKRRL